MATPNNLGKVLSEIIKSAAADALPTKEHMQQLNMRVCGRFALLLLYTILVVGLFVYALIALFTERVGMGLGLLVVDFIISRGYKTVLRGFADLSVRTHKVNENYKAMLQREKEKQEVQS